MRSGICPKCESENVYFKQQGIRFGDPYLQLDAGGWGLHGSELNAYVCTRCGYYETYISDLSILGKIEENWDKIE